MPFNPISLIVQLAFLLLLAIPQSGYGEALLAPSNFQVVPSNGKNTLSWNTSSGATGYRVKRSGVQNGFYFLVSTVSTLSYLDNNLTNGQTYWYQITAINAAGNESAPTVAVNGVPNLTLNPPPAFAAVAGNGQVSISWQSAPNADFYILSRSVSNAADAVFTVLNGGNPISGLGYVDTNLTNNVTYYYEIQSLTALGNISAYSPVISAKPILPITPPTNLIATAGDQTVTLKWNAGYLANTYTIKRSVQSNGTYTAIASGVNALTYQDRNLTNSQTYFYIITSVNSGIESSASVEVSATPVTSLVPPAQLVATAGDTTVTLDWKAPASGPVPKYYNVKRSLAAAGPYTLIGIQTTLSFLDKSRTNNQKYYYVLTSVNNGGESIPTVPVSAMPVTSLVPPTNLVAAAGDAAVTLSWKAPTTGAVPTSYNIKRSLAAAGPYTLLVKAAALSYIDKAVTNKQTYYYMLTSVNAGGESIATTAVSAMPVTSLVPPTNLVAVAGDASVVLNWKAPTTGKAPLYYNVKRSLAASGPFTLIGKPTTLTFQDNNLTNKQTYFYALTSVNAGDESAASASVSAMPVTSLVPPTNFVATAGDAVVNLSWKAPTTGAVPRYYNVKRSLTASGPYTLIGIQTTLSFLDKNLTNKQTYYYTLTSVNTGGESAPTAPVSAMPVTSLVPPTDLVAIAGDEKIVLSWKAPTSGAVPTSYRVIRAVAASGPYTLVGSPQTTTFSNTGLVSQQTYYYRVTSVNAGGESLPSSIVSATPFGGIFYPMSVTVAGNGRVSTSLNSAECGDPATPCILPNVTVGTSVTFTSIISDFNYYLSGWTATNSSGVSTNYPAAATLTINQLVGGLSIKANFTRYPNAICDSRFRKVIPGDMKPSLNRTRTLALDKQGNLYAAAFGSIVKFSPSGDFLLQIGCSGSSVGELGELSGIAVDSIGNIFVLDVSNNKIQKFSSEGNFLLSWTAGPVIAFSVNSSFPNNVVIDSNDNVYYNSNLHIYKYSNSGNYITQWDGSETALGKFSGIYGIAIDKHDAIYASDAKNNANRILKCDVSGNCSTSYSISAFTNPGYDHYNRAHSITVDGLGNLWALNGTGYLARLNLSTNEQAFFGNGTNYDQQILADSAGFMYMMIPQSNKPNILVKKNPVSGQILVNFSATPGSSNGQFNLPTSMVVSANGNILVADQGNKRIQIFDPSGYYLSQFQGPVVDGKPFLPSYVKTDGNNNIFVSSAPNGLIYKFDKQGTFIRSWGGYGTGGGLFKNNITEIAIDQYGDIYINDINNFLIQKFDNSGNFITQWNPNEVGATVGTTQFTSIAFHNGVLYSSIYQTDGRIKLKAFDLSGQLLSSNFIDSSGFDSLFVLTANRTGLYAVPYGGETRAVRLDSEGTVLKTWQAKSGTALGNLSLRNSYFFVGRFDFDINGNFIILENDNNRIQAFEAW